MLTISHGTAFRTVLMTEERAQAAQAMYAANPRFAAVQLHLQERAKGERRHFVSFQPASEERLAELRSYQQAIQDARAEQQWPNYVVYRTGMPGCYDVENQESGETYRVELHGAVGHSCTCPHCEERLRGQGLSCKHVGAVKIHQALGLVQPVPEVIPAPAPAASIWYERGRRPTPEQFANDWPD